MEAATKSVVDDGLRLRQEARIHNLPVETLRRVNGTVPLGCHPGPHTVFSEEEELHMVEYIINMADMSFGLSRENVMQLAYTIARKLESNILSKMDQQGDLGLKHFRLGIVHSLFTQHNHCLTVGQYVPIQTLLMFFFSKMGVLYGKHDLFTKPKVVFNVDETGVTIVHKPGKVPAELG